tara:strand:+ start:203 stop:550 length:348 start_codon:yes stop_codon:yes gene_type:complete
MADPKDEKTKAPAAQVKTETETKALEWRDRIDMDAMREQIRAEEIQKLHAENAALAQAEADRQAELDAKKPDFDEVVCMIANVHTSKGKMFKGSTKHLPSGEVDELVAQRKVKRT